MYRRSRRAIYKASRRAIVYGLLWGLVTSASELLTMGFGQSFDLKQLVMLAPFVLSMTLTSTVLAWIALVAEPWLDRWWKIALTIPVAAAFVAALSQFIAPLVTALFGQTRAWQDLLGKPAPSWENFFYDFWLMLLYGGLFIAVCVFATRSERNRDVLDVTQIARIRTEAEFDAAHLDALRLQIAPEFLLRVVASISERYATEPAMADDLLGELVAFLRLAMPGVRSGSSTVGIEIELARSFARLDSAIAPSHGSCHVEASAEAAGLRFPPFLLLPLLDAIDRVESSASLRASANGEHLSIVFSGRSITLTPELRDRVQVALRAMYGDAWTMFSSEGAQDDAHGIWIEIETGTGACDSTGRGEPAATFAFQGLRAEPASARRIV